MTTDLEIHPAAESFPMMDARRFDELVDDITRNGLRVAVTLCAGKILDGRNRYAALKSIDRLELLRTEEFDGDPWAYVWSLNGQRRDLVDEQRVLIREHCRDQSEVWQAAQIVARQANERRSEKAKRQHEVSTPRHGETMVTAQNEPSPKDSHPTRNNRAAEIGVKPATVARADQLRRNRPDLADKVRLGTMKPAEAHRQMKRDATVAKLESIGVQEAKAAAGVYDVIVIDPPWPMERIERDCRPNQVKQLDYPTMSIEEIEGIDLPAAEDCHVWLWTTHRFLRQAFHVLTQWGLSYVCVFVWHKPGGYQPVGLPQYNCEFAIYARRGSPAFVDTKAFHVCFDGQRGKHSEKPEEFYEIVRRVTAGRRLDMFGRRQIDGFDSWGKEAPSNGRKAPAP